MGLCVVGSIIAVLPARSVTGATACDVLKVALVLVVTSSTGVLVVAFVVVLVEASVVVLVVGFVVVLVVCFVVVLVPVVVAIVVVMSSPTERNIRSYLLQKFENSMAYMYKNNSYFFPMFEKMNKQ